MSAHDAMADAVFLAVKGYVGKAVDSAVAPLLARIAELEQRAPVPGPRGEQGLIGLPGPRGERGEKGIDGANGRDGNDGRDGHPGPVGEKGDRGEQGPAGRDGVNGKDAEVDYDRLGNMIAVAVEKEVGKFPIPRDGRDGKDGRDGERGEKGDKGDRGDKGDPGHDGRDVDEESIVRRVRELIPTPKDGRDGIDGKDGRDGATGPQGERGEKGDAGHDGKDAEVDYERVMRECSTLISREVSTIPGPKDGKDGANGRDADEEAIVTRVLAAIPQPKDGRDGERGEKGDPGEAVHPDSIRVMVRDAVEDVLPRAAALLPKPADGKSVDPDDVARMVDAEIGRQLTALVPLLKGEKGDPGLGFDDMDLVEEDGEVRLRFHRGDIVKEFPLPIPVYRGVWKAGRHRRWSCFTYGGSLWIAKCDTEAMPGTNSDWQLAVKRGRDAS
jgi:hypothetical protein